MNLNELKQLKTDELMKVAAEFNIESANSMRRQELIFSILTAQSASNGSIYAGGVLECLPDGFGFLRSPDYNYIPGPDDVYVSPGPDKTIRSQNRRYYRGADSPAAGERSGAILCTREGHLCKFRLPRGAQNKDSL